MSETSSDDFSDIEYTQTKNVVTNNDISDIESFGDFSPSANTKPTVPQISSINNKIQNDEDTSASDPNNDSFGSDEFEADPDSPPDDDEEDEDDISSKPEDLMNDHDHMTRGNKFGADHLPTSGHGNPSTNNRKQGNPNNSDLYYNARDYDNLPNVNNEIRRLFEYIERFKFNEIELETQLKPFIPDYIPSIGNVDSFLKPTKTTTNYDKQENEEKLGVYYLDEPILNQSDPSTFRMKLNNESKQVSMNKHTKVSFISDAERNTNKIRNWIDNFKKIKAKSLSNTVNIQNLNNMPNVEELMEPFIHNDKFNQYIKQRLDENLDVIPSYKIDLSLSQYAKIICNLLDIPIQNDDDINTSLHLLFTTYTALQST